MTDWDNSQEDGEGIKALRKQFKEQKRLLQEQQELIAKLSAGNRDNDISQALASRGLDPRVSKFYPKDQGTDDESVDKWVEENAVLFGNRRVIEDDGSTNNTTLTDAERRGYETLQQIQAYEASVQQDFESKIKSIPYDPANPAKAEADLLATLQQFGVSLNNG